MPLVHNADNICYTLYSKVGSIIETPGFYSNLTGYENLQILAKLRGGVSKSGVEKALEVVGLHKEKRKVFSDYSLGMKQRLGIAAAIMHEPELLILDEPINGLDPIGIVEIRSFLSELSHNHGITIFISSHVLSEIEQMDIFLIVCAKQAYRSLRWESKLQHHFHCCGFACSVSAEQTINFALWHMKIYLIDNGGCSVSLRKIFCFNDIIHI